MTLPASVEGGGRLRLFCALSLPDDALDRLVRWQREALGEPAGARVVPRGNLHLTLAFLGNRPEAELPAIAEALRRAAAKTKPPILSVSRYRETRSVAMVVFVDHGEHATRLAGRLQRRLERLGVYKRERRPWLPHVTVLRFREGARARLDPQLPDLGAISPSEAALYHSVLRPAGAQYQVLESVALGG